MSLGLCFPTFQRNLVPSPLRVPRNVGKHPATKRLIPHDVSPVCECSITLSPSACSPQTRRNGLAVVVDATRSTWRMTRACIRQMGVVLGADAAAIIVLRPEAFWDKQRVDNCARTQKEGEVGQVCVGGGVATRYHVIVTGGYQAEGDESGTPRIFLNE